MLVAHPCNPGYSGGRDQEDCCVSEASQDKEFWRPYLEKNHHRKGLVEQLKVQTLSSNPSTAKKKNGVIHLIL
jgi:hypothetical protein